ncbi:peptidase C39 family protein [Streptomyces sp. NPDC093272]|uniref:peptidase C39 family protein n=1 Tax=Streptomyces sp. NPDC093272 TaxID=3154981 RepID=UPI003423463B
MPPRQRTAAHRTVVLPYDPGRPPPGLRRLAPAPVEKRWRAPDRSRYAPHIVAVTDGDDPRWTGAALVTARPHTSYLKIVDAVGDVPAAVRAVLAHAHGRGLVQVKWEGWTADPEVAAAEGFAPLRSPLTPAEAAGGPGGGHVRWLCAAPAAEPPYYGQTTHFTCGAVTALVAQAHAGALARQELDRSTELTLWRGATNFPACEPVGLGVAVRRTWPSCQVTVHLDTDRPVLLGHHPEPEQEWRAVLQRASRTDARRTGVPVDPDRLSLARIRTALDRRDQVLLLVSLAAMQGYDVPHWVLCHAAVPGGVVIEDPWTDAAAGDTWVDAHLLPVPDAALDTMSVLAPDGFRGAVTIGRPEGAVTDTETAASATRHHGGTL